MIRYRKKARLLYNKNNNINNNKGSKMAVWKIILLLIFMVNGNK